MTVQELASHLADFPPDDEVHLVILGAGAGEAATVYDVAVVQIGGSEEADVHLIAGGQTTC